MRAERVKSLKKLFESRTGRFPSQGELRRLKKNYHQPAARQYVYVWSLSPQRRSSFLRTLGQLGS